MAGKAFKASRRSFNLLTSLFTHVPTHHLAWDTAKKGTNDPLIQRQRFTLENVLKNSSFETRVKSRISSVSNTSTSTGLHMQMSVSSLGPKQIGISHKRDVSVGLKSTACSFDLSCPCQEE